MAFLLWVLSFVGAVLGGFVLFVTFTQSKGAPQEAAGAAIACALAVLPYVAARSITELRALNAARPADYVLTPEQEAARDVRARGTSRAVTIGAILALAAFVVYWVVATFFPALFMLFE